MKSIQGMWENLPENILLKVFSHLQESDLVHASSTCTRWRRMFYEPRFWRTVTFNFNRSYHSHLDITQMLKNYMMTIGSNVEQLTIICPDSELLVHRHFTDWIKVILDTLTSINRTIRTFQMKKLRMVQNLKTFDFTQCDLIASLCDFIESQTCLQTLVLSEALLPTKFGHMVMSSLARSPSVASLEQVDIFYLYAFYLGKNPQHGDLIRSSLGTCQKLSSLTLSYSLLEAINAGKLCEISKHCLHHLHVKYCQTVFDKNESPVFNDGNTYRYPFRDYLYDESDDEFYCDSYPPFDYQYYWRELDNIDKHAEQYLLDHEMETDFFPRPMKPESWNEAIRACPGLKVSAEFHVDQKNPFSYLTPSNPLSHLTLRGIGAERSLYDETSITDILQHLAQCPIVTLESAIFFGHEQEQRLVLRDMQAKQEDLVNFLVKHQNIWSVQFSADLVSKSVLDKVTLEVLVSYGLDERVLSII